MYNYGKTSGMSSSYYKIGRQFSSLLQEHRWAVKVDNFNTSVVAEHAWNQSHQIDWDGATVLTSDSNLYHEFLVYVFALGIFMNLPDVLLYLLIVCLYSHIMPLRDEGSLELLKHLAKTIVND